MVVAAGGVAGWAVPEWSPDGLRDSHGDCVVRAVVHAPNGAPWAHSAVDHVRKLRLRDYVAFLRSKERDAPCYMALEPIAHLPGLRDAANMESLAPDPSPEVKLSIGSDRVQIGLHFDYEDNIFAQVYGQKRFCLVSPRHSHLVYPSDHNVTQSELNDASEPDLSRFPLFGQATVIEGIIGPGELLVLPRTWWHHFHSIDETISLACFFGSASFVSELAPIMGQLGPGYLVNVAKQLVVHGLLGRKEAGKLYSHPPNGLVLYRSIVRALKGQSDRTVGSFFDADPD